jgi:general stress protein 26
MTAYKVQPEQRPEGRRQSPVISDYEDFRKMALSADQLDELVSDSGQCVFTWTTRDGYPVGVVMAYIYRHGKFWLNCTKHRKRVTALRSRPQCGIVITNGERMASLKGRAAIHAPEDPDWDEIKSWFYAAVSGTENNPDDASARSFEQFLDGPNQVIIETVPTLVVSFDFGAFLATTQAAIASALTPG